MTNTLLPSWNDTPVKKNLIEFVRKISDEKNSGFIPKAERIAVFDNDGTLWTEYPMQIQIYYMLDRMKALSEINPGLKITQPFKALFEKDMKTISTFTKKDLMTFVVTTMDGKTPEEFISNVTEWFDKSEHPIVKKSFYNCIYKPQRELLDYLRANGFKIFIVSGGGLNFMRAVAEKIYGIPPEQVIGSSGKTKVEYNGCKPVIKRLTELNSFDDRDEKVNNISLHIGRRPVFVFGNSDGDLAMMRYTLNSDRPGIAFLLHHDDQVREAAYDKEFKLSPLKEALEVAEKEGINVVSMKNDWKEIFV